MRVSASPLCGGWALGSVQTPRRAHEVNKKEFGVGKRFLVFNFVACGYEMPTLRKNAQKYKK